MLRSLRVVLLNVVPAAVIVGLIAVTIRGPSGLFTYWQLTEEAAEAEATWSRGEVRNNEVLLELQRLSQDPIAVERLAADELGLAAPDAVLFVFTDEASSPEGR